MEAAFGVHELEMVSEIQKSWFFFAGGSGSGEWTGCRMSEFGRGIRITYWYFPSAFEVSQGCSHIRSGGLCSRGLVKYNRGRNIIYINKQWKSRSFTFHIIASIGHCP